MELWMNYLTLGYFTNVLHYYYQRLCIELGDLNRKQHLRSAGSSGTGYFTSVPTLLSYIMYLRYLVLVLERVWLTMYKRTMLVLRVRYLLPYLQ